MRKILPFIILIVIGISSSVVCAQTFDGEMTYLPAGTTLTLKQDLIIPAYEGIISVDNNSENYKVNNLVFDSKGKRRILRKGTEFEVESVEVAVGKIYIHIKSKLNWIYFGDIKSRSALKIKELQGLFEVNFPEIEEF